VLWSTDWTYEYQKSCIQPCHGHFTGCQNAKMCRFSYSSFSASHFLFPRNFSGTIEDTDIINTARTATIRRCAFWGWNTNFCGVNRRFRAKRAKYLKFHAIETTASILTKFGVTIETTKWSSWVVPVGAQQSQDGGRPPFWKKTLNHHLFATVPPTLMKFSKMTHIGPWHRINS